MSKWASSTMQMSSPPKSPLRTMYTHHSFPLSSSHSNSHPTTRPCISPPRGRGNWPTFWGGRAPQRHPSSSYSRQDPSTFCQLRSILILAATCAVLAAAPWVRSHNNNRLLLIGQGVRHSVEQVLLHGEKENLLGNISECSEDATKALREQFHDVVLIINNNYETYAANTTNFWRRFYSRFFDDIVILSSKGVPELGIEAALSWYPDAPDPWWGTWMFHFWALRRIILRYPNAAGYLWTNDDVIINYWNLVDADKTKLWLPNNPDKYEYMFFNLDPTPEEANKTHGNWASRIQFRKQIKIALSLLDDKYKRQYNESLLPLSNSYAKRGCDLFYIPQRHANSFVQDVLPAVQGGQVVSELAIPFIFFALDNPANFSHVLDDMVYQWDFWLGNGKSTKPKDNWNGSVSAFHPWKVSSLEERSEMLRSAGRFDGCLEWEFPDLTGR